MAATVEGAILDAPADGGSATGHAVGRSSGYRLEQRIRYDYDGPVHNLRQRLVVVPPSVHGRQRCSTWRITVEGASDVERRTTSDRFGNTVVEIAAARVEESVTFMVDSSVLQDPRPRPHVVRPRRAYLAPTPLTRPDARIAAMTAAAATAADPIGRLCSLVHRSLQYQWGVTGVATTAADALRGGQGVCQDYAHIMLAGCRLSGIAARYVSGHLTGEGGSHAWVEVLRPDPSTPRQWSVEAWDPTHDSRAGDGHVTVAVGRDYRDVAPMSGCYDGEGISNRLTVVKSLLAA
jgi:transglutaminase-like putative cysteine protease